jgi:alanine racemase
MQRPVWVEVNLKNIKHNYSEVRRLVGADVQIMAVVKANAYGHGAVEVAKSLAAAGADCFGVAIMNEAIQLREAGIDQPILIMGWTPIDEYELALKHDIMLTIYSREEAEELSRISAKGKKARAHIKVDTGMGRIGVIPGESGLQDIARMISLPGVEIEGIFTHLAKADEVDKTYTNKQLSIFNEFVAAIEKKTGFKFRIKHAANSAAVIDCPDAYMDMVRPGIMLYGLKPSEEVKLEKVDLQQAISWRACISHVKIVPANVSISYGGVYKTPENSLIITVPLGYADGYSRLFSAQTEAICYGQRIPLVGRICMDQMMLNATALKALVKPGDIVTLIGGEGDISISVDELARILGTINYEIVCMISNRVPRVYHG